jgi:hypothetical protein
MPDITMCNNHRCKMREGCFRYVAEPSDRQSYCYFMGGENCDSYWSLRDVPKYELKKKRGARGMSDER